MVPARVLFRRDFPLNANGKVDRRALLTWASEAVGVA
jgi:acyl-CoA synthetase (AMP-forming)/AMP-acid ligase II